MPTQCKPLSFAFQGCQGRRVAAAFDGGAITSNAGVLLLREIDRSIGILDRVADCFTDYRDPRLTEHSVRTLVRPARRFKEFLYATLTSWSCQRRVVAKAEHLPGKSNPRFVVTSLPDTFSARTVYERVYCPRGNMENAIKEQQLDLFSDRTSASRFAANQLRLLFSAFASILFEALRRALHGTRLARANRRNPPAQAPQDRRPRHGLDAKGQGRHGLRTPIGRRLRAGSRPITRVTTPPPPSRTPAQPSLGDHCAPGPKTARSGSGSPYSGPSNSVCGAACSYSIWSLGRNSAPTLLQQPSAVTV